MELDKLEELLNLLQSKNIKSFKDSEVELEFQDSESNLPDFEPDGPFEVDWSAADFDLAEDPESETN